MKEYIFYNTFISWIPSSDEFRAEEPSAPNIARDNNKVKIFWNT